MSITDVSPQQQVTTSQGWIPGADTFGSRLALVRQRMGWGNVAEAATQWGLPVASWRNWERDNREPHRIVTVSKQIATPTGWDYRWLVHGPGRGDLATGEEAQPGRPARDPLAARIMSRGSTDRAPKAGRPTNYSRSVRETRPVSHQRQRPTSLRIGV